MGAPEAVECCQLLGFVLTKCLAGISKDLVLDGSELTLTEPKVLALAAGRYLNKSRNQVRGSGYAVASLEAAPVVLSYDIDIRVGGARGGKPR